MIQFAARVASDQQKMKIENQPRDICGKKEHPIARPKFQNIAGLVLGFLVLN